MSNDLSHVDIDTTMLDDGTYGSSHIRSDCKTAADYIGAGVLDQSTVAKLFQKMAEVALKGNARESVGAFRALISSAKLSHEIAKSDDPKRIFHSHLHRSGAAAIPNRIQQLAAKCGIDLQVASTDHIAGLMENEQ